MLESLIRKVHKQRPFVSFKKTYSFSWYESFKLKCIVMNLFMVIIYARKRAMQGAKEEPQKESLTREASLPPLSNLLTLNPCSTVFRTTAVWARHLEPLLSLPLEADFPVAIGWSWIHWRGLLLPVVLTGEALCLHYYPWSTDNLLKKKNIHVFYKLLQRVFMTFTIFVEHWVSCRGTFCS